MGVLVVVVVVVVLVFVVTGGKQSQLLVPRLKSGLWTEDWSLTIGCIFARQISRKVSLSVYGPGQYQPL